IFELGRGPVGVAAGIEHRNDDGASAHDPCSRRSWYWQCFGADFPGESSALEGYVATAMPFIRGKRGAELLELDVALRQTHYKNKQPAHVELYANGADLFVPDRSGTIDATTWKFSLLYDATNWFRIRATNSRDI